MTYMQVLKIYPGEGYELYKKFHNSYHGAFLLWDYLGKNYIRSDFSPTSSDKDINKLWALFDQPNVPLCFRAMLGMTFDRAIVQQDDYLRAEADIKKSEFGGHWPDIQKTFSLFAHSPIKPPAIGFIQTTVCESLFPHRDWEANQELDETGQIIPNVWSRDYDWTKVFDVYKRLEG